jgi:hypothetical protein
MNQFTQIITNELDKFIGSFFLQLSSNQSISIDILEKEWNDFCGKETKVMITSSTKKTNQEKIKCAYVFSKGKNIGEQCSKFVKDGQTFCYLHNSKEDKKEEKEDASNCLFKLSGTNYWWHKDTRLVFPSQTEKLVIAKYFNGDLQKLEDEDIKLCKKFKLNYDQEYNFNKIYDLETPKTNKTKISEKKSEIKLKSVKEIDVKPTEKVESKPDVKQIIEKKVESKPTVKEVTEKSKPTVKQVIDKNVESKPIVKQVIDKKVESKPTVKQVIEKKAESKSVVDKGNSKDKNILNFNYSVMPIENVLKKIYDDSDESATDDEYTSEDSESSTDSSSEDSDNSNSNDDSDMDNDEDSNNDDSDCDNEDDDDSDEESELLEEED